MKKIGVCLLAAGMFAACGGGDSDKNEGEGGATQKLGVGVACSSAGEIGCSGTELLACSDSTSTWVLLEDCADRGRLCGEDPNDATTLTCIRDQNVACDYDGYTSAATYTFMDPQFGAPYFVYSWDADPLTATSMPKQLIMYVPPGQTTGTVDVSMMTNTSACGESVPCVIAALEDERTFIPVDGTLTFGAADGNVGGAFRVTLDVTLTEVTLNNETGDVTEAADADTWCLNNVTLSATIRPYPCALAEMEMGGGFCGADIAVVQCVASGDELIDGGFGGELVVEMCPQGTTCAADEAAGTAACQ